MIERPPKFHAGEERLEGNIRDASRIFGGVAVVGRSWRDGSAEIGISRGQFGSRVVIESSQARTSRIGESMKEIVVIS